MDEFTLKTDFIAKIRLGHCIKRNNLFLSDGIGKPPF
jgi:hypothetical protein